MTNEVYIQFLSSVYITLLHYIIILVADWDGEWRKVQKNPAHLPV